MNYGTQMLNDLLAGTVRTLNAPMEAFERLLADDMSALKDEDRLASAPLEVLAKSLDTKEKRG